MSEVKIQNQIGIKGAYSYQVIDSGTGDMLVDVPEQSNLVLDNWLLEPRPIPSSTWLCIGAGVVTPPAVTDVDLGNQIKASSISFTSVMGGHSVTSDSVIAKYSTVTDFTGFSGEQVSEIGIRKGGSTGTLLTRALIKDQSGNPTSIVVNAGQTLRITYSIYIRIYAGAAIPGETATPHGPLKYAFQWPTPPLSMTTQQIEDVAAGISACQDWLLLPGGGNRPTFLFGQIPLYYNPVIDTINKTASFTVSFPATASDRTVTTGTQFPRRFNTSARQILFPTFVLTEDYTLPANYDFSSGVSVTWGRLP